MYLREGIMDSLQSTQVGVVGGVVITIHVCCWLEDLSSRGPGTGQQSDHSDCSCQNDRHFWLLNVGETTPLRHLMQEEGTGTKVSFITKTLKRNSLSTKFLSYIKFKPMWIRKCSPLFWWQNNNNKSQVFLKKISQNYKGWVPFFTFYFLFHMIQYRTW